jgi:hypothetical protein
MNIEFIQGGHSSERYDTLPVVKKTSDSSKRVLFSHRVLNLKAGDVIQVLGESQITNDLGYNVMVKKGVRLGSFEDDVNGKEITEYNGDNITPAIHHKIYPVNGMYVLPRDYDEAYINWIFYAASTGAQSGHTVKVDNDTGRFNLIVFRK